MGLSVTLADVVEFFSLSLSFFFSSAPAIGLDLIMLSIFVLPLYGYRILN